MGLGAGRRLTYLQEALFKGLQAQDLTIIQLAAPITQEEKALQPDMKKFS